MRNVGRYIAIDAGTTSRAAFAATERRSGPGAVCDDRRLRTIADGRHRADRGVRSRGAPGQFRRGHPPRPEETPMSDPAAPPAMHVIACPPMPRGLVPAGAPAPARAMAGAGCRRDPRDRSGGMISLHGHISRRLAVRGVTPGGVAARRAGADGVGRDSELPRAGKSAIDAAADARRSASAAKDLA